MGALGNIAIAGSVGRQGTAGNSCRRWHVLLVTVVLLTTVVSCVVSGPRRPSKLEFPPPRLTAQGTEVGVASWYGPGFAGRKTASGEIYDPRRLTAAHPTLPLGTAVRVADLETGRSVRVRINDRGPFVKGRIIDLSRAAAESLDMIERGVARVEITVEDPRYTRWPVVRYAVQAGAFRSRSEAHDVAFEMASLGDPVYIVDTHARARVYRVRLGPYGSRRAAEAVAARVRTMGHRPMVIEENVPGAVTNAEDNTRASSSDSPPPPRTSPKR